MKTFIKRPEVRIFIRKSTLIPLLFLIIFSRVAELGPATAQETYRRFDMIEATRAFKDYLMSLNEQLTRPDQFRVHKSEADKLLRTTAELELSFLENAPLNHSNQKFQELSSSFSAWTQKVRLSLDSTPIPRIQKPLDRLMNSEERLSDRMSKYKGDPISPSLPVDQLLQSTEISFRPRWGIAGKLQESLSYFYDLNPVELSALMKKVSTSLLLRDGRNSIQCEYRFINTQLPVPVKCGFKLESPIVESFQKNSLPGILYRAIKLSNGGRGNVGLMADPTGNRIQCYSNVELDQSSEYYKCIFDFSL